jgi:hypothetical protein
MRTLIAFLIGLALLSHWPVSGQAAQLPALPQTFIDTTYSPPSGTTINVPAGGNFQQALNNAVPGNTIVLEAGATYVGPYTLPNKTGAGWIYIRSSAYANLPPPGTRVSVTDAVNMPKITVAANQGGTIETALQAHHYRFVGIEFRPVANNFVFNLIDIGSSSQAIQANLPNNITFDRCYIHGDPALGSRRGIAMNGSFIAVIDSYISDFKEKGADTQAVWSSNGAGPFKIVNNYLEAAGENVMFGGAEPAVANLVPSDIEIRRNHISKPLSWIGAGWTIKNLMEFKNARRILVEGNLFENSWAAAQDGEGIVVTPRNEDGGAPWSATQDITIRLNKILNVGKGFNLSGRDTNFQSQVTQRVLFENNVVVVTRLQNATGRIFQVTNGPVDTTIRHNTALITVNGGATGFSENQVSVADQFDFRDNIVSRGQIGFGGTGTSEGNGTLNAYYTNYFFQRNAIIGASQNNYPANNFFPANTAAVGFVDYPGGNYRLSPTSTLKNQATDGTDVGANIDAIEAAISGVAGPLLPPIKLRVTN